MPEVCVTTLPGELRAAVDQAAVSHHSPIEGTSHEIRIRVSSRADTLEKIAAAVSMLKDPDAQAFGQQGSGSANASQPTDEPQKPNAPRKNGWTDLVPSQSVICEHDFFALGYTWWQTQVLTRRLRYTSNLDHLHFENRLVEAARAFVDGRLREATEAMHDCFDALAEERDHYFSSDPSLIDLTLLTPGTIDSWLETRSTSPQQPLDGDSVPRTALPTPENLLVDEDVAVAVADGPAERRERFRQALERNDQKPPSPRIADQTPGVDATPNGGQPADQPSPQPNSVGWLGGGPSSDFSFDEHSIAASEQRIASAVRAVRDVGTGPLTVYGRLGGGIAGEWVPAIAAAGFDGIVPVDFLNGRGFDDESKVLLGEGDQEVEALTSKPIDADDESSFLTLSTKLGEEIDRGEIATALMVHWPGGGCDSFHDVRRAASWSLCLGRFWRIDDYFTDGERPYHHGAAPKATPASAETVADLKRRRSRLHDDLRLQSERNVIGYAALVNPEIAFQAIDNGEDSTTVVANVAASLGFPVGSAVYRTGIENAQPKTSQSAENVLLMHASFPAARTGVHVSGKVSPNAASVFDAASSGNGTDLIVDVPAWGFSAVGPAVPLGGEGDKPKASSALKKLSRWLTGGGGKISKENRLSNEFMEVSI
ncbi:glycosyl hydrolase 38 domain-containing protein, partial [Rhodopirellula sallentina SM41]